MQLYSGVKTALDRNPGGLSLASITMQHTSEAQQAALQSNYMDTGASTHTYTETNSETYLCTCPHASTKKTTQTNRNYPLCKAAKQDTAKKLECPLYECTIVQEGSFVVYV